MGIAAVILQHQGPGPEIVPTPLSTLGNPLQRHPARLKIPDPDVEDENHGISPPHEKILSGTVAGVFGKTAHVEPTRFAVFPHDIEATLPNHDITCRLLDGAGVSPPPTDRLEDLLTPMTRGTCHHHMIW